MSINAANNFMQLMFQNICAINNSYTVILIQTYLPNISKFRTKSYNCAIQIAWVKIMWTIQMTPYENKFNIYPNEVNYAHVFFFLPQDQNLFFQKKKCGSFFVIAQNLSQVISNSLCLHCSYNYCFASFSSCWFFSLYKLAPLFV